MFFKLAHNIKTFINKQCMQMCAKVWRMYMLYYSRDDLQAKFTFTLTILILMVYVVLWSRYAYIYCLAFSSFMLSVNHALSFAFVFAVRSSACSSCPSSNTIRCCWCKRAGRWIKEWDHSCIGDFKNLHIASGTLIYPASINLVISL